MEEMHEIRGEEGPNPTLASAPAPAAVADGGGLLGAAEEQLIDHEDGPLLQGAAAAGEGGGGHGGALHQQLIDFDFEDHRLQAASFFLVWGCCVLINSTTLNPAANLEHKFAGFVVLTVGAWLAILTLAGGRAGRVAARAERFLRGLFF